MQHIIVGGTHGLGHELAAQLQVQGESTFVVGRSYDAAEHGNGLSVDLAHEAGALALAKAITELEDPSISFYWVSGYGYNGDFADQDDPQTMAAVNFGNVLPAAQTALRRMLMQPEPSHFVVVSSTSGFKARTDEAVYTGTKHAQVGFTRSIGQEVERLGAPIQVALFMPGGMQTPFWDKNPPAAYDQFLNPQKVAQHMLVRVAAQTTPFYEEVIERGSL